MFNLKDLTFIIPVYIESKDRYNNAKSILSFLNNHFLTNVIIHEFVNDFTKLDFLKNFENLTIKHIKEKNDNLVYHRTRQLNEMLSFVETPVVCNYDIDVLLPVESYLISEYLIKNKIFDVVYPFGIGQYQYQVDKKFDRKSFNRSFDLNTINEQYLNKEKSEYGHCVFFDTDKYKSIGGENENFISYAPEDAERYERSFKFGLKIHRIKNYVYHFEHSRTKFSDKSHEDYLNNQILFDRLKLMDSQELEKYYLNSKYLKKYNFKLKTNSIKNNKIENKDSDQEHKDLVQKNKNKQNVVFAPIISNNIDKCICGEIKNKFKYNFCQKCNRLY